MIAASSMVWLAAIIAAYLGVGLVATVAVSLSGSRRRDPSAAFIGLSDIYGFLLWPLWVFVACVERRWPESTPAKQAPAESHLGDCGIAATTLRPAGKISIGDRFFDARADAGIIAEGTAVVVLRRELNELVVKAAAASG